MNYLGGVVALVLFLPSGQSVHHPFRQVRFVWSPSDISEERIHVPGVWSLDDGFQKDLVKGNSISSQTGTFILGDNEGSIFLTEEIHSVPRQPSVS